MVKACALTMEKMDDDAPEGWIYDGNGRPKNCPLIEIDTPNIDAVEVVRCKDCKHWGFHKWLKIPWCREMHIDRGAEDFCSNAERRTDDN